MKIVIPVTSNDFHLLETHLSVLEHFGGIDEFDILIAPSSARILDVEPFLDRYRLIGKSAAIINVGYTEAGSWPAGPNQHWTQTVFKLDADDNHDCWFWMELDCLPTKAGWAKALSDAYTMGKQFFCGKIVPTPHRDSAGNILYHPDGDKDMMMMGCAVYPAGMSKNREFQAMASGFLSGSVQVAGMPPTQPWDVKLRWFFKKSGWTHTDLIGDRWNTVNYRMENGKMVCDAGPTKFKNRAHHDTDIEDTVLVHGCKDDSLAKIILGNVASSQPIPVKHGPYISQSLESLQADIWGGDKQKLQINEPIHIHSILSAIMGRETTEDEEMRFSSFTREIVSPPVAMAQIANATTPLATESITTNSVQDEVPKVESDSSILMKVNALLRGDIGDTSIRLNQLARECDTTPQILQAELESSQDFAIVGPSKWVKRKKA